MKERLLITAFLLSLSIVLNAQVGANVSNPDTSSVLDISSFDKGVLIPRVELQSTTDVISIADPANSLLVFNTSVVDDVTIGFYRWSTSVSKWIKVLDRIDQPRNVLNVGYLLANIDAGQSSLQTSTTSFNFSDEKINTIGATYDTSTKEWILPQGEYLIESSIQIRDGGLVYTARKDSVRVGLGGVMVSVMTQQDLIHQKQIAILRVTNPAGASLDFFTTEGYEVTSSGGVLQIEPAQSYLKISKLK
jgi:hypothetical protein